MFRNALMQVRKRLTALPPTLKSSIFSTEKERQFRSGIKTALNISGWCSLCVSAVFLWPDHLFEKYPEAFGMLQVIAPEWVWGVCGVIFSVVKLLAARYGWARVAVFCTAMAVYAWGTICLATLLAGHIVLLTGFGCAMSLVNVSSLKELVRTIHATGSDTTVEQRRKQHPSSGGSHIGGKGDTSGDRQDRRSIIPR